MELSLGVTTSNSPTPQTGCQLHFHHHHSSLRLHLNIFPRILALPPCSSPDQSLTVPAGRDRTFTVTSPACANTAGTGLLELFPWVYFHLVKYPGRRTAGSALSSALALSVPCAGQSRQDMKNPWNIYRHMWVLLKDGKQPWISLFGSKCPWSQHEGCPFRG